MSTGVPETLNFKQYLFYDWHTSYNNLSMVSLTDTDQCISEILQKTRVPEENILV